MSKFQLSIAILLSFFFPIGAFGGFSVTLMDLRSTTRSSSIGDNTSDSQTIDTISNPLLESTDTALGMNSAVTNYDFSWLEELGIGDFNTSFSHRMRNSLGITTVTNVRFFIETDIDLLVSLTGSVDYSHTPGDETQFLFGMAVTDVDTLEDFYDDAFEGGNADLLPASGTLNIDEQFIVPANRTLFFGAALYADNFDITAPGIYDANGFANISIRPVPEPTTAVLLLCGAYLSRRPRR